MNAKLLKQTAAALLIAITALAGCKKNPPRVSSVALNQTTLELTEGQSATLVATVSPADAENKAVSWAVSGDDATVDQGGKVTAVKAGEATITVTTADGGKTAAAKVTVKAAFVAVTGISGIPAATTAGTPLTLTGTVAPANATNNTIAWSIAGAGTTGATITGGNTFNATAAGTATVTATIAGGKAAGEDYAQEFTITVSATGEPETFIAVAGISGVPPAALAGTPLALTGTLQPANATNKTTVWSITNAGTTGATITAGNTFNATAAGTATIRATIAGGKTANEDYTQDFTIEVSFDPGDGTAENPFKVYDVATLQKVGSGTGGWNLDKYYLQTADIDVTSIAYNWTPIGTDASNFTGSYDGSEYTISDLKIDATGSDNQGLFGCIGEGGTVKNVELANASISGRDHVGGIAGKNYGTIDNCSVVGGTVNASRWAAGGVVGQNAPLNGTVRYCYATCVVNGMNAVGGVAGDNMGTVQNCYATGSIGGLDYVGGVTGNNIKNVLFCYASGYVSGTKAVGGVVGNITIGFSGTVQNCVALSSIVSLYSTPPPSIGRVAGYKSSDGTLSGNYARESMVLSFGSLSTVTPTPDINGKDGANVVAANINGADNGTWWSGTAGFSSTYWIFEAGKLPILKGFAEGTQNPQVQ